jgi:hypothetical protein
LKNWVIFSIIVFILFTGNEGKGKDILEKELRSVHFIIYYHRDVKEAYVNKIKDMCEKYYFKITQEFNLIRDKIWIWENRAKVYIAKDKDDYLTRFNCPRWSEACVNHKEKIIYTYPDQERFASILIHELTHIIFKEYVRKNEFPLWLDEGVAVYMENKYSEGFPQANISSLKRAIIDNSYIPFSKLNDITTFKLNSEKKAYVNIFYIQSFSIVYFLIKSYGRGNFSRFLFFLKEGYGLDKALSKAYINLPSIDELEKKWKRFYQG